MNPSNSQKGTQMRSLMLASGLALVFAIGAAPMANAAVNFTTKQEQVPGGQFADPGAAPGEHVVLDFGSTATPAGITRIDGAAGTFGFGIGDNGNAAEPAGDGGQYFYVSTGGSEEFLFSQPVASTSFYWGSGDDYNAVDVLGGSAKAPIVLETITGDTAFGGQQRHYGQSARIYITGTGFDQITGLRFRSASNSFEFDNVAIGNGLVNSGGGGAGGVPEPATWAMLLLGMSSMGAALRARRRPIAAVARST